MKSKNMDINLISEITGLTIYKIKNSKILNLQKLNEQKSHYEPKLAMTWETKNDFIFF